jgi:hypothetical protein
MRLLLTIVLLLPTRSKVTRLGAHACDCTACNHLSLSFIFLRQVQYTGTFLCMWLGILISMVRSKVCNCSAMMWRTRDENGRKRSVNTKTITVFIFFIGNKIENGNSGNGNDIGISETSETKVRCGKYTGNGRNLKYDR